MPCHATLSKEPTTARVFQSSLFTLARTHVSTCVRNSHGPSCHSVMQPRRPSTRTLPLPASGAYLLLHLNSRDLVARVLKAYQREGARGASPHQTLPQPPPSGPLPPVPLPEMSILPLLRSPPSGGDKLPAAQDPSPLGHHQRGLGHNQKRPVLS